MLIHLIGCSHHDSSVAFRERLAYSREQIGEFLAGYYAEFPKSEAVLLSTCNRTELYVMGRSKASLPTDQQAIEMLTSSRDLSDAEIEGGLFSRHNTDAIRHLFRVSSSLDSMVVGEAQILSQVKTAFDIARQARDKTPLSRQVFDSAIRVARRVTTETDIHTNRVSIPSIAVNLLARQIFERLDNKKILVLGAGEMADETLRYLIEAGGRNIVVCNRTHEKAEILAMKFGGAVADWSDMQRELGTADMVISTTGSGHPIMTAAAFAPVVEARQQKPMFILDLAVPRDFEDAIGNALNVYLYSLDDLRRECERNLNSRRSQWPKALSIVETETERFLGEIRRRSGGATIAQLKQQAGVARDAELTRLFNRLESVNDTDRKQIEMAFDRLVNKILHPPLSSIQDESKRETGEHGGLLEAMKRLFQLSD